MAKSTRADREAAFWAKGERQPNGCLLWTSALNEKGYGTTGRSTAGTTSVHRSAWILTHGPIPDGMTVDHACHHADKACAGGPTCPHRRCFEPAHLRLMSLLENSSQHVTGRHTLLHRAALKAGFYASAAAASASRRDAAILRAWKRGATAAEIAAACGMTLRQVVCVLDPDG